MRSSQTLPAAEIQAAAAAAGAGNVIGGFSPCVDGVALPRDPFDPDAPAISADVPVMIGTNKDEATLFLFADPKFGDYTEEDLAKRAKAGGRRQGRGADRRGARDLPRLFAQPPRLARCRPSP